jgi:hypothetical protein
MGVSLKNYIGAVLYHIPYGLRKTLEGSLGQGTKSTDKKRILNLNEC